jgi:hypothetical protein
MTIKLKGSDGDWRNVASVYLKNSDVWKNLSSAYLKVSGSWKLIFSSSLTPSIQNTVTISQSTDGITYAKTLTGTNYYWINSTGMTYRFDKSTDSGTNWTQIASGSATNPSSGSSNTNTYLLQNNLTDVSPNATNIYRYVVTATNSTYSTSASSTSGNTTIYGPENITIVETSHTYNSVSINWTSTAAANAANYLVYYKLSSDATFSFSSVESGTTATISSLLSSTSYDFKVIPITGINATYRGYQGNDSNTLTITTNASPVPTQLTSPSISGTGYAFAAITGTSGTYQSGTFQSKTSYIGRTIFSTPLTSGLTSSSISNAGSSPYNVNQNDATAPKYYFYYIDEVLALDGTTFYYYYSSSIDAKIGQVIDNYTRTVSGGLGTMTPIINSAMSPNSYIYSLSSNGSLWSVNGSVASITSTVSGSTPTTYPQQSVILDGTTDAVVSASFPSGSEGLGLTFWSTDAGSWWASRVNKTSSAVTKYVYYTTATIPTCPDNNTGSLGTNCKTRIVTSCPDNSSGSAGSNCKTRTVSTCPDNSSGNLLSYCKQRTVGTCPDNGSGSAGSNCKSRTVSSTSCPDNGSGSAGSNCKSRTSSTCPNNGSGNLFSNCKSRTTSSCPDNGSGSAGSNCKTRTSSSCPNNGLGSAGNNCKTRFVNGFLVYDATVNTTIYDSTSSTIIYDAYVNTTVYDSSVSTNTTVYDYPGSTIVYDAYVNTTVYDSSASTTEYDASVYGCTVGPNTQYGGSLPTNCSNSSSSVTVYNTRLDTLKADGSSVSTVNTENIFSNEESPSTIGGISVSTSGNNISTTLYSNTARSSTITTKSYTASNPTKSSLVGQSAFGIIKTPPGTGSGGTQFDDFQIN